MTTTRSSGVKVRPAASTDQAALVRMRAALWPSTRGRDHDTELADYFAGRPQSTLPLVILVADGPAGVVGFVEVGLRSHADGCDPRRPVGYVEGWFVDLSVRGHGAGQALMAAAEAWARTQGCAEMASDTWQSSPGAQRAHITAGFELVDRCVHYRKRLAPSPSEASSK